MAKIRFLDPRSSVDPHHAPLVSALDTLEGKVIGIIDNGQSNSTAMFKELAALLRRNYSHAEVLLITKPTHMQGAPAAVIEDMARRCDVVITGLGA
jgi:hypothetical protein